MKKKSIAVFDLDNTIYKGHSYFGSVKNFIKAGIVAQSVDDQVMNEYRKYKAQEQAYGVSANNMLVILATALTNKSYAEVKKIAKQFFESEKDNFYTYFLNILPKLKETHEVYLVTTNGQMVAEIIVEMFGLDGHVSTVFEVKDGVFTGNITQSLADGKKVCVDLVKNYSGKTIGAGDSINDIGIFETVKYPLCINPSDDLKVIAQERGWDIVTDETVEEKILTIIS